MNDRDELARLLDDAAPDDCPISFFFGAPTGYGLRFADAILAAGYRKQRTITTAEELDALPEGSAVLDDDHDVSTKHNGKWHGYEMAPLDNLKFAKCGPFTVLYEPS